MSTNADQIKDIIERVVDATRLIGLEPQLNDAGELKNWRLDFKSDGLSLEEKQLLEEKVSAGVSSSGLPLQVVVNFRRESSAKRSGASASVSAPAGKDIGAAVRSAFGLKIQKRAIPNVKRVIAVASGKGGVGKSTISTNLAVALARTGKSAGLLDADIYGPSSPTMLGLDIRKGLQIADGKKIKPAYAHGVYCASFGFFSDARNPVIWRGPMVAKAFEQMCFDVEWPELDYLVIDLPPGTGDIQLSLIERIPMSGAVIVSTPQDVALIDAHKAVSMFEKLSVPIVGLVENMAFHRCGKCGNEERIFGEGIDVFCHERGIALLGSLELRKDIRIQCDAGEPVANGSVVEAARVFAEIARMVNLYCENHDQVALTT